MKGRQAAAQLAPVITPGDALERSIEKRMNWGRKKGFNTLGDGPGVWISESWGEKCLSEIRTKGMCACWGLAVLLCMFLGEGLFRSSPFGRKPSDSELLAHNAEATVAVICEPWWLRRFIFHHVEQRATLPYQWTMSGPQGVILTSSRRNSLGGALVEMYSRYIYTIWGG